MDSEDMAGSPEATAGVPGRTVTKLTDPRALRAYAHPIRMKLVGLLRTKGPLTATRAAELLGESSGTCSFHLRQLAKYGLVEEAGGGTGRQKPWRATTTSTAWDAIAETPEAAAATELLNTISAEEYFGDLMRWLEASANEPPEWQDAALLGDRLLYVTADELADLGRRVMELVDVYFERLVKPELRPPGARLVSYLHLAFPNDVGRKRRGGADTPGRRRGGTGGAGPEGKGGAETWGGEGTGPEGKGGAETWGGEGTGPEGKGRR